MANLSIWKTRPGSYGRYSFLYCGGSTPKFSITLQSCEIDDAPSSSASLCHTLVHPLTEGGYVGHIYIPQDDVVDGGAVIAFLHDQGHDVNVLPCLSGEEYVKK